jgi:hypothetical protein
MERAPAKDGHVIRETGSGKGTGRGGACLRSSVELRQIKLQDIKEGSGTPANADPYPPHLAMRLAPFWSALAWRRSTAALT